MSHRLSVIHKPPIAWTLLETAVGAFLVFGIDVLTGSEISVGVFYLFPVFRGAWKGGRASVIVVGILCTILWIVADLNSGRIHPSRMIVYWNAMVRFGYIFSVAYLSLRLREEQDAHILMARTDSLTNLPNRLAFLEVAGRQSQRSLRQRSPMTVAYIDLDNFKLVNDQQGHDAGDELLRQVGHALKHSVHTSDLVARLGGDEFAILLPDTQEAGAQVVMDKIRSNLMKTMKTNHWPVTFSIGCITFLRGASVDIMIRRADALMYEVKHGGKDTINFDVTSGGACRIGTETA